MICKHCQRTAPDTHECRKCPNCGLWGLHYEPSQLEIAAACLEIQATWTAKETEHRKASAYRNEPVDIGGKPWSGEIEQDYPTWW